jgi:hypothetical protein
MIKTIQSVSSSEFAGKFGQWSFSAQKAPVKVVNNKTGNVLGYFISEQEFEAVRALRDLLPRAAPAWDVSPESAAELDKPLPRLRPELDRLMED